MKTTTLLLSILVSSIAASWGQGFDPQFGTTGSTNIIGPVPTLGTLLIDYNFYTIPDSMDVYYDTANIFSSGLVSGAGQFSMPYGPGLATSITIVVNDGPTGDVWVYMPTIVPEPSSISLIVLGLSGYSLWAIRKKQCDS